MSSIFSYKISENSLKIVLKSLPGNIKKIELGGLAVASALFQSILDSELRKLVHTHDAEEVQFPP